eukprot:5316064-Pyramimonas_sp.AAC.1
MLDKLKDNRPDLSGIDFQGPAESFLFARGIFEHPGDIYPRPLSEGGLHAVPPDRGDYSVMEAQGDFHFDGCCFRH